MKRFAVLFAVLFTAPAFAEVAPVGYWDEIPAEEEVYTDEEFEADPIATAAPTPVAAPVTVAPAPSNSRASAPRAGNRNAPAIMSAPRTNSRTVAHRAAVARTTAANNSAAPVATRARAAMGDARQNTAAAMPRRTTAPAANVARAAGTSIVQTDTVNTPLYTGRKVSTRASGGNLPIVVTATTTPAAAATTSAVTPAATAAVDSIAEMTKLTDACKAQYNQCMDQFCDVLDDNQGRCSCSSNLDRYADTESALKKATEELQEVAQAIQYIGLSKAEVETIFTQTEAEAAMDGKTDTTQLKRDLDGIKAMLIDVGTASTSSTNPLGIDLSGLLEFSFDSTGFDIGTLFGTTTAGNISNQRGAELFKTATARCRAAVLDSCAANGVDTAVITNTYDLEIDKQCIAYERDLDDANDRMSQTVRNAKSVLQKARLIVSQQKNQYDLRGCINELDACMQDDFVCGDDYENCLDPTGRYIVGGEIVVGSEPGLVGGSFGTPAAAATTGLYTGWNYDGQNAWTNGNLDGFIKKYIASTATDTTNMVGFLQQKIGYNERGKNYGMCISVLNKCQDVSYTKGAGSNKQYAVDNKVVENYLYRTLALVKAQQDEIMAEHGERCISNITTCLATNGYSSATTANATMNLSAENACAAQIQTCASITGAQRADIVKAAAGQY